MPIENLSTKAFADVDSERLRRPTIQFVGRIEYRLIVFTAYLAKTCVFQIPIPVPKRRFRGPSGEQSKPS